MSLQLFVTAVDEGVPSRTSSVEARVQISITRNENDPLFFNTPYDVTIPESEAVGTSIYSVTVSDADTTVSGASNGQCAHHSI